MKPDGDQLYRIYQAWKTAVEDISDVEGLYPTFVMNVLPASAASVAKNNGVGNTWGLEDDQPYIREYSLRPRHFAPGATTMRTRINHYDPTCEANICEQCGNSQPVGTAQPTTCA